MTKSKQNVQTVTTTTEVQSNVIDPKIVAEVNKLTTMSAKIRYLNSLGWVNGKISKFLTENEKKLVRYQWVRNVLITPIKKAKA